MQTMEHVILEAPRDGEIVDPMAWFESPGPFEVEIGCGKGGFLLSRARAHPDRRFLGIEWAGKYFRYCADRMARWDLSNVRVLRTDAKWFFLHHLPPACIHTLHLYHPDPWPKKRHHKRRLVQGEFVEAAIRALAPAAEWLIQSDHDEYFACIRSLLDSRPELAKIPWEQATAQAGPGWTGTNFEIKYAKEGRSIHRVAYVTDVACWPSRPPHPQTEATTSLSTVSRPTR